MCLDSNPIIREWTISVARETRIEFVPVVVLSIILKAFQSLLPTHLSPIKMQLPSFTSTWDLLMCRQPWQMVRYISALTSIELTLINVGNKVTVNADTLYPFSDTLNTTITASSSFTYHVRIPSWVTEGTISVNGGPATRVNPSNGLQAVQVGQGTTTFVLNLPVEITLGVCHDLIFPSLNEC